MKRVLTVMCLFLSLVLCGCQCTLHTHYYNDRGVCVCGHDVAQELVYENEEYSSASHLVKAGDIYYYKLTSHGEEGVDFYIDGENVSFDRIEIRADGMLQTVAGPKNYSETIYSYSNGLVNERMYFFKITYEGEGSIKLIVRKVA